MSHSECWEGREGGEGRERVGAAEGKINGGHFLLSLSWQVMQPRVSLPQDCTGGKYLPPPS